jgi:HK97 family phage major capsid protein
MHNLSSAKPFAGMIANRASPLSLSAHEKRDYSLFRAIQDAMTESSGNSFEREVTQTCLKRVGDRDTDPRRVVIPFEILFGQRDLNVSPVSAGGALVATGVGPYIDNNRAAPVLRQFGAEVVTGLIGNVTVPRATARSTIVWQNTETTPGTETANLAFGAIAASPKTAVANMDLSRLMRMQAAPLVDQVLRTEFAATAAELEDEIGLAGSGAAGQPLGIIGTPGIGSFNGASITYANTREAETDVLSVSAARAGGVSFACRPAIASLLSQRNGHSANAPIWTGPLARGQVNGCPALSSQSMPAGNLLAGDFGQLLILQWGLGVEIRVNPYANFQAGITNACMFLSMDIVVRQPAAFTLATGVT